MPYRFLLLGSAGLGWFTPCCLGIGLLPAAEWNAQRAAHLLRRAGFGGTPQEIARFTAMGLDDAVEYLVDYEKNSQTDPDFEPIRGPNRALMREQLNMLEGDERREVRDRLRRLDRLQIEELRAWWLRRMVVTPRPLEEKMTLFWHGHFTSGHREVRDSTMLYDQNALLRAHALGNFRDLLVGVSQDPAMLRYLDNASNRKQAPNENYARELLELFTMGEGSYTETDIKEAARALTGWTLRGDTFFEARRLHDRGVKTFLDETGPLDGYDIIDIILKQPATARHLARKTLVFFVREDPPAALVELFASVIRANRYDMREALRALFKSEAFYAPEVMRSRIKSPVELVVGTLRLLEIKPVDTGALVTATRGMGQSLFQPPNVKGWDGGRKWINTATIFARYNFASGLLRGTRPPPGGGRSGAAMASERMRRLQYHREEMRRHLDDYPGLVIPDAQVASHPQPPFDPAGIMEEYRLGTADKIVNHFVERLLQTKVDHRQRKYLKSLVAQGKGGFHRASPEGRRRVISLINALLTMPEYQVN